MDLTMQQAAKQLLDRPVQGEVTLGQWMETQFPQIIEYATVRCQRDSQESRGHLARMLGIYDLAQPFGSDRFEKAYRKAGEALRQNPSYEGLEEYDIIERQYKRFYEFKDMGVQMQHDLLQSLKDLSHDAGCNYVRADDVVDMLNAGGTIAKGISQMVPRQFQLDDPQQAYNQFAEDMKTLLKCAYLNDVKRKSQVSFVDHVSQSRNRLEDYWRKH